MISRVIRVSGLGLHSYAPQLKLSLKLQVEDANTGTSFTPPPGTSRTEEFRRTWRMGLKHMWNSICIKFGPSSSFTSPHTLDCVVAHHMFFWPLAQSHPNMFGYDVIPAARLFRNQKHHRHPVPFIASSSITVATDIITIIIIISSMSQRYHHPQDQRFMNTGAIPREKIGDTN